jgi:hypothetical protein
MRNAVTSFAFAFLALAVAPDGIQQARAQADPGPALASVDRYLMPKAAEVALARSAAPASVAGDATVMVLGRQGYTTAAEGKNGFVCYVERSWARNTDDAEFLDPKMRAPNCFNAAATGSISRVYLMKTGMVLAGKSRTEIAQAVTGALDRGVLPAPAPGAMCYMMSKDQYFNARDRNWHPHLMFYAAGDVAKSWGANLPGSPLIGVNDPQTRVTTFMMVVNHWSDGTPGPPMEH